MIVRTDAIVLGRMNYGETSQIVRLFTRDRGKLSVIAKGARRMNSKFGSSLEPLSHSNVVFYYKSSRGLQTLSESTHITPFLQLRKHLHLLTLGFRLLELTQALMQEEQEHQEVFDLLRISLTELNNEHALAENILPYFQLQLASYLGIRPAIDRNTVSSLTDSGGALDLEQGAPIHRENASSTSTKASRSALRAYSILARASFRDVMRMQLQPEIRREVNHLVDDFLRYHLQESYPDRSSRVLRQMEGQINPEEK